MTPLEKWLLKTVAVTDYEFRAINDTLRKIAVEARLSNGPGPVKGSALQSPKQLAEMELMSAVAREHIQTIKTMLSHNSRNNFERALCAAGEPSAQSVGDMFRAWADDSSIRMMLLRYLSFFPGMWQHVIEPENEKLLGLLAAEAIYANIDVLRYMDPDLTADEDVWNAVQHSGLFRRWAIDPRTCDTLVQVLAKDPYCWNHVEPPTNLEYLATEAVRANISIYLRLDPSLQSCESVQAALNNNSALSTWHFDPEAADALLYVIPKVPSLWKRVEVPHNNQLYRLLAAAMTRKGGVNVYNQMSQTLKADADVIRALGSVNTPVNAASEAQALNARRRVGPPPGFDLGAAGPVVDVSV